jgi:ABC-type branched-subunit amino acid transport system substrate-binding protein
MIASDVEVSGGRVLIQEIPLGQFPLDQGDDVRLQLAATFERLARAGATAPLLNHFGERGRQFLVFEMPTGDVLLDRMTRVPGPVDDVSAIGYVLRALDTLEQLEQQIPPTIHGNLCPTNIIVRPDGQVTFVGYSITVMLATGATLQGQAGGIAGYAAPEQSRGQASTRSDLFALCALLHHAVTGTTPSPRAGALYPSARRINPAVSLELEEVLSKGLRPAPNQRYQSAAELRQALAPLASGQRLTHVSDERQEQGSPSPQPALMPVRDARGRLVLPRRRFAQQPLFIVAITLVLVVLISGGLLAATLPRGRASATPTATPNDLSALFQSKGVALSGGEFIFDTQTPDNNLKQQAAVALAGGDVRGALADFRNALLSDPTDAEAAIYAEDLQVQLDGNPYVTVVVATAFAAESDQDAARDELQGAYLAQARANQLATLPGNVHVRLLILNSGQNTDDATTASHVLLRQIQAGNAQHLIGIVGWPESAQTRLAISALAPTGLALVSPTADADGLGGIAANFFAMVPSRSQQATLLATAAVNQLQARRITILYDGKDTGAKAAGVAFATQCATFAANGVSTLSTSYSASTANFTSLVTTAVLQGSDLIFFSGDDAHALKLAQALDTVNARTGGNLHALVDSAALTPDLLGAGTSATAQSAHAHASALRWLYVTSLADTTSWNGVGAEHNDTAPSFFLAYAGQFGSNEASSGLPAPDAEAILANDAANILITATQHDIRVTGATVRYPAPTAIRNQMLQFNTEHPYVGAGGAIAFTQTGSLPSKALPIMQLISVPEAASTAVVVHPALLVIAGGRELFCGSNQCKPAS